jgi:hypothetical protein
MAPHRQNSSAYHWPLWLTRAPVPVLMALVLVLSLAVLYVELPGRPLILHAVQKLGHPVVFGLIATGLFGIRRRLRPFGGVLGDYLPTLIVGTALGFFTEIAQVVTHRDPALKDVMLDVRGITCALALLAAFDPRCRRSIGRLRSKHAFLAIAALIAAAALAPLAWVSAAYIQRAWTAPTLFEPGSALDLLLVSLTDTAPDLGKIPVPLAHTTGEQALRVPLTTRPYAGVSLDEPLADWRRYHSLRLDVMNPTRSELALHVRVQDRNHDGNATDRYEGLQVVAPMSRRSIEIRLADIASAPGRRTLDLGHISGVTLYKVGGEGPRELWLGKVGLD